MAAEDAGSTFDVLAREGRIPADLATAMRAAVALRNRVAHGYAAVDHGRLHADASAGIESLRRFLVAVSDRAGL
jgi:uncharacterized protein YutE (UPF0331/DUF86 family)